MSLTKEEFIAILDEKLEAKFDEKLAPIYDQLERISRDLSQIRRDLGYNNLEVIKRPKKQDLEEM
jgi:hypothetical protein